MRIATATAIYPVTSSCRACQGAGTVAPKLVAA
jgi:hypothetical protein